MKRLILYFFALATSAAYAQPLRPLNPKVQKATVYLQGAHLFYTETVTLGPGTNDIVFENVSPDMSEASLQASSKGGVVMDVKHNIKYKQKEVITRLYDKDIENVLDSIEDLNYKIKDVDNKLSVITTAKTMLLNNRIVRGEPQRDSLALLRDGMQFLQAKLNDLLEQELELTKTKNKANKLKNKLNERYQTLILLQSGQSNSSTASAQPIHQVIVTMFAETPGTSQISFNYFVQQASWIPQYELQASSTNSSLQLKYFAQVYQNSGIEWTGVPLTLSTSNPSESNTKPELTPWYLSYYVPRGRQEEVQISTNRKLSMAESTTVDAVKSSDDAEKKYDLTSYVSVVENIIRTEYEIKLNYTIASDGKTHKVMINQKDVPMQLQFEAVPKLSTDAFLMARVSGWEDMNILSGNARLYFDGAFVGEMVLNANTTSDTLNINLGRDKSIAITRKKLKENYKVRLIGDEKVETRTIELVVRNTKNIPIDINLEDQIPVPQGTNDIKVMLVKGDGAYQEEATGKLKWRMKLGSKDTKKVVFTYEVTYPKGKPVAGL